MAREESGKYCWRLWPFTQSDHGWIPAYLQDMERKGLRFCGLSEISVLAKYERTSPSVCPYQVGLLESAEYEEILPYLTFCEGAGWEVVWQLDKCEIFRSTAGGHPVPMETDPGMQVEQAEKWAKDRRDGGIGLLLAVVFLNFLCFNTLWSTLDIYTGSWGLQMLVLSWVLFGVFYFLEMCRKWRIAMSVSRARPAAVFWKPDGTLKKAVCWCTVLMCTRIFINGMCAAGVLLCILNPAESGDMTGFIGVLVVVVITRAVRYGDYKEDVLNGREKKGVAYPNPKLTVILALISCLFIGTMFFPLPVQRELGGSNYFLSSIRYEEDPYVAVDYGKATFVGRSRKNTDRLEVLLDKRFGGYTSSDRQGGRVRWTSETAKKYEFEGMKQIEEVYYYPDRHRVMARSGNMICLETFQWD